MTGDYWWLMPKKCSVYSWLFNLMRADFTRFRYPYDLVSGKI